MFRLYIYVPDMPIWEGLAEAENPMLAFIMSPVEFSGVQTDHPDAVYPV